MIPKQLVIEGLYSYQERQLINFERLTEASLFGIFGSVGSGKSSILEAITFALYGDTDRLNAKERRGYNMMNLKSDKLYIEFIFDGGKERKRCKAVVQASRNRKNFDDVKTIDRKAYQQEYGEWVPLETSELERIVGLSYENFKRTIIIPQGKFQEFLQLGATDRTRMMKELFGLERFDLYDKARGMELTNMKQMNVLEGKLQQLGTVDPEQATSLENDLTRLHTELEAIANSLINMQKLDTELEKTKELTYKMHKANHLLSTLKEQEADMLELEKKIGEYERCHIHFRSSLDARNNNVRRLNDLTTQLEENTKKCNKAIAEIQMTEGELSSMKPEYDQRETLKQRCEDLSKILQINVLKNRVVHEESRMKKGNETLKENQNAGERIQQEKLDLDKQQHKLKSSLPDLAMLAKIKTWYTEKRNLEAVHKQQLDDIEKANKQIISLKTNWSKYLNELPLNGLIEVSDWADALERLQETEHQLRRKLDELQSDMNHLYVQLKLEGFANALHPGEPCPLCGATEHPQIMRPESVAGKLKQLEMQKKELEVQISTWVGATKKLENLQTNRKMTDELLAGYSIRIQKIAQQINEHETLFCWKDFREEAEVERAFSMAEKIQGEIKDTEEKQSANAKEFEKQQSSRERFIQEINKIQTEIAKSNEAIKTLSEQLNNLDAAEHRNRETHELESERGKLLENCHALEKRFTQLTSTLTSLQREHDTLIGSMKSIASELEKETTNQKELQQKIDALLATEGYNSLQHVEGILKQTIRLDDEKAKVAKFKEEQTKAVFQTTEIMQQLGDKSYDVQQHEVLKQQMDKGKVELAEKNQAYGKTKELLLKLTKELHEQKELKKTMDALKLRAANIATLKSLFAASGFVNYISSVYLQNLCMAANERFYHLTRKKLQLELSDDNNFVVRDFMNGGKVRNVKTLSGGQTFQASLSLALALSDNIQHTLGTGQNFFFLDEGFGSLDKESLAVVFDTLKTLHKENRVVGLISHVEEMQQEIDAYLRVTNHPERGSLVECSW